MHSIRVLILSFALLSAGAAQAQMYPGEGVTVNPVLLQPGMPYPGQPLPPVHLHMPMAHHRVAHIHRARKVAADVPADTSTAPPATSDTTPADTTPPPRRTRHRKTEVATAAPDATPAPDSANAAIPFNFSGAAPLAPARPAKRQPAPKPAKVATAEPPPVQTPPPDETETAPAKSSPSEAGLAKHGEIVFNHNATDPAPAQYDGLKLLAGDLNAALQSGATRILLEAFGGAPGDKGSDARRLSLKRALAIRQVLIDNGVPSGRIDVRAMGGVDDHGNADRVDVLVRGG
ncbi:MAG TPA: OmpA family protein [Rhizomicrobium sp.]|jgi:outer membrane protein OmpA-like peptidoglycan-associated protein|nr:OmpA family protein [Rhizomicrobium sp.]